MCIEQKVEAGGGKQMKKNLSWPFDLKYAIEKHISKEILWQIYILFLLSILVHN